jgi:FeS assembly SUF system protein
MQESRNPKPEAGVDAETPQPGGPETSTGPDAIREQVIEALRSVYDPEIPVNIYELGLIYEVQVEPDGGTRIRMTLTTPMCPAAEMLPPEVETKARTVPGVTSVAVDLVWDPPWSPDMMSEAARLDLGMV